MYKQKLLFIDICTGNIYNINMLIRILLYKLIIIISINSNK